VTDKPITIRRGRVVYPEMGEWLWYVSYPTDDGHWDCCRRTDEEIFPDWETAKSFAFGMEEELT